MTQLLAKALGRGVEVAALTPYSKWRELLSSRETISDVIFDPNGTSFANFELLAVQELNESSGETIEVRVLASDGYRQLTAYFYAIPAGTEVAR